MEDNLSTTLERIVGASRVGFGSLRTWAHFNETEAQKALALVGRVRAEAESALATESNSLRNIHLAKIIALCGLESGQDTPA